MTLPSPKTLVIRVRFFDGRYHGEPEWPPAPARLFQALLAGACRGAEISNPVAGGLRWLESLAPPEILAPRTISGEPVKLFVPNNDLDSKNGDPSELPSMRTPIKNIRSRIFDGDIPLLYLWTLDPSEDSPHASAVCELALGLYQLGRGVDMASASAKIMDSDALNLCRENHPGKRYIPSLGATRDSLVLSCPQQGSLDSLDLRHRETLRRLRPDSSSTRKAKKQTFHQPPKPRFRTVAYDLPPHRALFEFRRSDTSGSFYPIPLAEISRLTEKLRDAAAQKLTQAVPELDESVERALIGRPVEGKPQIPTSDRVRLVALPSIGHPNAVRSIRRLLVEVPTGGSLSSEDIFWAFDGLKLPSLWTAPKDARESRVADAHGARLTRAAEEGMLQHYAIGRGRGARTWRTITPAALPDSSRRRRIDPAHHTEEAKDTAERMAEEVCAASAVHHALRHAGVEELTESIHVQREPFDAKGARAETFAPGTRFAKELLWHVEVVFREPVPGPLVVGNGRFLGLGLMAPVLDAPEVLVFTITEGLDSNASAEVVAQALRRAVMARYQREIGSRASLPEIISGHGPCDKPSLSPHLAYTFDPLDHRLLIVAPTRFGPSLRADQYREMMNVLRTLEQAMVGFTTLRAGAAGALQLMPSLAYEEDPLLGRSSSWISATPYTINRHTRGSDTVKALTGDILACCRTARLPTPEILVSGVKGIPGRGLTGQVELRFQVAVQGPLLLGRTRHKGGGLFRHKKS